MSADKDIRQHNRERLPTVLAFADELRRHFGDDQVQLAYARESGFEAGREPLRRRVGTTLEGTAEVYEARGTRHIGPRAQPTGEHTGGNGHV